ncbi:MAG: type II secretion system protein N, partial [Gammaproteobacteria bacterium]
VAYLVLLLATLPAGYVVGWLHKRVPELQLAGVHGSVWAGSAQDIAWQGQSWGLLRWRFDWAALFAGHAGFLLFLNAPDLALQARVAGNSSKLLFEDVAGHFPVNRVAHWLPLPPGSVAGQINISMQRTVLINARPSAADGIIKLTSLSLSWPQPVALGDYELKLQTQDDGIHGSLLDTSGPLMVQGSLRVTPDGGYDVTGVVASRDPANTVLNNLLQYLPSNPGGKHTFNINGKW